MAKNTWKELLPCKECYQIVKNKDRLKCNDLVVIKVYSDSGDSNSEPFYTFQLTCDSIIRPGAQRNRQLLPLLSDKSLERCHIILEENALSFHKSLWYNLKEQKMQEEVEPFLQPDMNDESKEFKLWKREKKKEFKNFYSSLQDKTICHGKDCHVDFYLSNHDNSGIIAKIKRKEKLQFAYDSQTNQLTYIGDTKDLPNGYVSQYQNINTFEVIIYSGENPALKIKGNVFIKEEVNLLSLDDLSEQGLEFPDEYRRGLYG